MSPYAVKPAKHGLGLYAIRSFNPGDTILASRSDFPRITYEQLLRKRITDNPLQISARRYLDWSGPIVRTNHACEPNCGLTSYPKLELKALKPIAPGEELRWDYSTSMDAETECSFTCHCGAASCRGVVRGFATLPKRLQTRYAKLGVVQQFLLGRNNSKVD